MSRKLAIAAVVLCLAVCAGGAWLALLARDQPFIAPTAADLRVTTGDLGERVISYRMGDPDIGWLTTVARRLSLSGWSIMDGRDVWGRTESFIPVYTRASDYWFVHINERAELRGDRQNAEIRVFYTIRFHT